MITGGYDLQLHCMREGDGCPNTPPMEQGCYEGRFCGHNEKHARKIAREAGWKFTSGDVLCPACAKESEAK